MSEASPWKVEPVAVLGAQNDCWLTDIMSEELAAQMVEEERNAVASSCDSGPGVAVPANAADDDFVLAQLLQHEFDREHDFLLELKEAKFNGNGKVRVSFEKYRTVHPLEDSESSEEEDDDWREFLNHKLDENKVPTFGPSGVRRQSDGTFVSKHDKDISGRKNTNKVLDFPPEFQTGDAVGIDLKLSNNVYNKLKRHSEHETQRRERIHDKKEKSTAVFSVDANTRLILFKLINGGLLDSVSGAVSTGKEAVVFHAFGGSEPCNGRPVPPECALKVFKTTLNEFKNRCEYVKDDYRFKNPRKVLKIWAEKEMLNLNRMRRAGVRCPTMVKLKKHVLVMSFIGADGVPAPKLKDVQLDSEHLALAFHDCVQGMTAMYDGCNLVHADLSEFNILYWEEKCWLIDVSQAVDTSHPKMLVFLARDCTNICEFFRKRGLEDVPSPRQLFNDITDLDIQSDDKFYGEVQDYQLENRSVERRKDKQNPADCTLRKQLEEERLAEED